MNNFILLILLLILTACQSKQDQNGVSQPIAAEMQVMPLAKTEETEPIQPPSPTQPSVSTNRKIIRNAQIRIRVSDFKASGLAIEQAVQQTGGQITYSNETKTDNSVENELKIRIPAPRLDALVESVLNESIFTDTKTITSEDITRQYIDIEARIRSKKAVEETYLNLLKQARSVADVLKVEEQLGHIREEREVQEAELRQLKDEVALSTLNLTYYQQTEGARRPKAPFYSQIWSNLIDGFRLMETVIVGLFYFLPIGLIVGVIIWLYSRWRRQRSRTL